MYFVRHGENRANLTKEFSYRLVDYPLTPKGRLQAGQTADFLAGKGIQAIVSSPLRRAIETAEIIAARIEAAVTIIEGFREVNVGDFEAQPPSPENWAAHNRIIHDWLDGHPESAFPGGEDFFTLRRRVLDGLRDAVMGRDGQTLLWVGHGGSFSFVLGDLCPGVQVGPLLRVPNHNCSISRLELEWDGDRLLGRLTAWARIDHLSGEAAVLVSGVPEADRFDDRSFPG
jgi:probable phosphoglycerate mutase